MVAINKHRTLRITVIATKRISKFYALKNAPQFLEVALRYYPHVFDLFIVKESMAFFKVLQRHSTLLSVRTPHNLLQFLIMRSIIY